MQSLHSWYQTTVPQKKCINKTKHLDFATFMYLSNKKGKSAFAYIPFQTFEFYLAIDPQRKNNNNIEFRSQRIKIRVIQEKT